MRFAGYDVALIAIIAGGFLSDANADTATDVAAPVLQFRADIRALAQHSWPPPQTDVAAAIRKTFDLARITETVLGARAAAASAVQKDRLAQALAMRMAREAMHVPVNRSDDGFSIVERRQIKNEEWLVTTRALMPAAEGTANAGAGDPVVVSWRVAHSDVGLRIVDMLRDGVSAVLTQRDDFKAALARQDLDTAIARVERLAAVPP